MLTVLSLQSVKLIPLAGVFFFPVLHLPPSPQKISHEVKGLATPYSQVQNGDASRVAKSELKGLVGGKAGHSVR